MTDFRDSQPEADDPVTTRSQSIRSAEVAMNEGRLSADLTGIRNGGYVGGLRQLIPSSRQDNWALVSETMPSPAEGQTKRPFSSRLA